MSKLSEARRRIETMGMAEAQEELKKLRRQLFDLRFQLARGEVKNNRQFPQIRADIARLMYHVSELNREERRDAARARQGLPPLHQAVLEAAAEPEAAEPETAKPARRGSAKSTAVDEAPARSATRTTAKSTAKSTAKTATKAEAAKTAADETDETPATEAAASDETTDETTDESAE